MCGSKGPSVPKFGQVIKALDRQSQVAEKQVEAQLAWAKEEHEHQKQVLREILDVQLPLMKEAAQRSEADRKLYEELVLPIEKSIYKEAMEYDTEERRSQEANRARADVASTFDAQRRAGLRELESFGLDPSEVRHNALDSKMRTAQAVAEVSAATDARRQVEETGRGLRMGAAMFGRGLNEFSGANAELAARTGQSAIGGANQTAGTMMPALGNPAGWQDLAGRAQLGRSDAMDKQMNARMGRASQSTNPWGAAGTLIGMGVGGYFGGAFGAKAGAELGGKLI